MTISPAIRWMLLALTLLLAACTGQAGPQLAPTAAPLNETTTLILWHGWSGAPRQALNRLVDRFNMATPQARVFAQPMPLASMSADLRAAAAAGTGPHVVLLPSGWLGGLAADAALLPLNELISADALAALIPAAAGSALVSGSDGEQQPYGQPISFDTLALFYNRQNILRAPETTADLLTIARGLSEPTATPARWGFAISLSVENTIPYLYAFDGRLYDDQGALTLDDQGRAGAERWLGWIAAMNADQQILARPSSSVAVDRGLKSNQALMTFGWAHQLSEYQQLWGDQLGVAPLPRLSETNNAAQPWLQSEVLALNARIGPAEQRAAALFLNFMSSDEAQRELLAAGLQPASATLPLEGEDALVVAARSFRQQAQQAQPLPNSPERAVLREELWQMQRAVIEGRSSPADAVSETAERLRAAGR
ncbi:MAG: extracellular solute-binding protein [Roseiflexaceae bacterium]|nr:extracellular solute-binding protein [Roseiflexaceae bacterium]